MLPALNRPPSAPTPSPRGRRRAVRDGRSRKAWRAATSAALALGLWMMCVAARAEADEPPAPPVEPPATAAPPPAPPATPEPRPHPLATPGLPTLDLDALEKQGAVIGTIRLESVQIFDPRIEGEDKKVYRLVNHLHVVTRQSTIRHQLLFAEGEPFVKSRLEETERNLRALPFLQDALVAVEDVDEGRVNILVRTQDAWTTRLGFRFGSSGGKSTSGLAISEINLLGTGKRVRVEYKNGLDRSTKAFTYEDPNVLGSRLRMRATHEDSSDGQGDEFVLQRPFFSIETRLAYGVDGSRNEERVSVFQEGDVVDEFTHNDRDAEGYVGWSRGAHDGKATRWLAGYSYEENTYEPVDPLPKGFPEEDIPVSRTSSGPYAAYEWVHHRYIKVRNFERFSRAEDFNLGAEYTAKVEISRKRLGATDNEVIYTFNAAHGFQTGFASYLFGNAQIKGRAGGGREQGSGHIDVTHYYTAWPKQTLLFKISGDRQVNGSASDRYLLGGETGLRGYSARRFEGDNRILVNVEDRVHFEREFLHVLRLGVAGFLDFGNAWGGTRIENGCIGLPNGMQQCGRREESIGFGNWKADVGVAILGDVVRASGAGFIRLNIAYPINGAKYDQGTILLSFGRSGAF